MQESQSGTSRGQALFCRIHKLIALSPVLLPLPIYGYAVAARLSLGAWPYYGHVDPKDLGFQGLLDTLWLATMIGLALSVIWLGSLPLAMKSQGMKSTLADILLFAAAALLVILCLRVDPGGLVDWYFD